MHLGNLLHRARITCVHERVGVAHSWFGTIAKNVSNLGNYPRRALSDEPLKNSLVRNLRETGHSLEVDPVRSAPSEAAK
jgi:hypothetical protein